VLAQRSLQVLCGRGRGQSHVALISDLANATVHYGARWQWCRLSSGDQGVGYHGYQTWSHALGFGLRFFAAALLRPIVDALIWRLRPKH